MKRCGYVLLAALAVMALACGGSFTVTTTAPPTTSAEPALNDNQVKGFLVSSDPKTGELTMDMDGTEHTYGRTKKVKFLDEDGSDAGNINNLLSTNVILTFDKQDGKDVVTEIRETPRPKGPSTGTQARGKFMGADFPKDADGTIHVQVDGQDKTYPLYKNALWYDLNHQPVTHDRANGFRNVDVILVLKPRNGGDKVTEVWAQKD